MTFRSIITAVRLYFVNRKFKTKDSSVVCREYCLALLALVEPNSFANYKPTEWSHKKLHLLYPHVDEFNARLAHINRLIVAALAIESSSISDYRFEVDMDTFFTSKAGFYINHVEEVKDFKKAAHELCSLTESYDKARIGIEAHNRRLLTPVYADIRNVTLKLLNSK